MCTGMVYCLTYIQLLCYALQYSTGKGTVNVVLSVMMRVRLHLTGRVRKEKVFQIGHGRIAFYEHGGKTGRAMVKYPLYKKNAQRKYYPRIPRFGTVSIDR